MKWAVAIALVFVLIACFFYAASLTGTYTPMGRLGFVKLQNPDMAPGNPHSKLVAEYAKLRGSNTALVVHLAGHRSGYPCYYEGDVLIMELGFLDKGGYSTTINWGDVIQGFLFGIPDDRYEYISDGIIFDNLDDALAYLENKAAQSGQEGPRLMFWHGTVRSDNPIINQGCGLPLYYKILEHEYGRFGAYYYTFTGMIFPYLNNPYRNFELMHASELQYYYNHGLLGALVVD